MNYKIFFGQRQTEIAPAFIESFSFVADFQSLYSFATLILKDFTRENFNFIQKGMDILFVFYDGDSIESSSHTYRNPMKVSSYSKIPAPQSVFNDLTELNLVHTLYFDDNKPGTKSYEGSVHTIANTVLADYNVPTSISVTDDPSTFRYQCGDTPIAFLRRITRFGYQGNLPVYLYMDATGTMKLKGISEFIASPTFYTATPLLDDQIPEYSAETASTASNRIILMNYKFISGETDIHSVTNVKFEVSNFTSSKTFSKETRFKNAETNNIQSYKKTPEALRFSNWNLNPFDAFSLARRQCFEQNLNVFYLVATTTDLRVDTVQPGALMKVLLPYDTLNIGGQEKNLGEGEYLVKRVTYLYDKGISSTQFILIQANY